MAAVQPFPSFPAPACNQSLVREVKFVSDRAVAEMAADLVAAFSVPDAKFPVGVLESVYYDTPDFCSHSEKTDGDALKRKIRVRWYRDVAPGRAGTRRVFLEVKDRIGSARDKSRFDFEWDANFLDNAPLDDPGFLDLLGTGFRKAGWTLSPASRIPSVSIRYRRRRFFCPASKSRLSVDSSIECTRANAQTIPFASPMVCPLIVVEAKSDSVRTWPFAEALNRMGFRICGFSKYGYFLDRLRAGAFDAVV